MNVSCWLWEMCSKKDTFWNLKVIGHVLFLNLGINYRSFILLFFLKHVYILCTCLYDVFHIVVCTYNTEDRALDNLTTVIYLSPGLYNHDVFASDLERHTLSIL